MKNIIGRFKIWLFKKTQEKEQAAEIKIEKPKFRICYKKDEKGKWWWRAIRDGGKVLAISPKGYKYVWECISDARNILNMDKVHSEVGIPEDII